MDIDQEYLQILRQYEKFKSEGNTNQKLQLLYECINSEDGSPSSELIVFDLIPKDELD